MAPVATILSYRLGGTDGVSVEAGSELGEPGEDEFAHLVKGPYVVETFPVSVQKEYVVVEIP